MFNQYMNRYIIAAILTLASCIHGYSQVKIEGPAELRPGKVHRLTLSQLEGNDLQFTFLKNGEVYSGDEWSKLKDFEGKILLWGELDEKPAVYTIIAVVNKDNKSYSSVHVIKPTTPIPPAPVPVPPAPENTLTIELVNLYRVSPDADTLTKIISVISDVKDAVSADKIANYGDLEKVLVATAQKTINNDLVLRPVRDRIAKYLIDATGNDPRKWNKSTAVQALSDILAALRAIDRVAMRPQGNQLCECTDCRCDNCWCFPVPAGDE